MDLLSRRLDRTYEELKHVKFPNEWRPDIQFGSYL